MARGFWTVGLTLILVGTISPAASALVVINEFLADPPAGEAGDANQDGTRSASEDEFVEFFNVGSERADLSGWSIWDALDLRHLFAGGIQLESSRYLVVFGGGDLSGFPGEAFSASTGSLRLNNAGDQILLKDAHGQVVDQVAYGPEADRDQSLSRFPEGVGPFQLHQAVSSIDLWFSPGTDPEGKLPEISPPEITSPEEPSLPIPSAAAPEPASALLVGIGWLVMGAFGRRRGIRSR